MPEARYNFERPFQLDILRLYIQDPHLLSTQTDAIKPSYFTSPDLQMICNKLLMFYYKYKKVPSVDEMKVSILSDVGLPERPVYINLIDSLYDESTESNLEFVRDAALRFGGTVELARACRDIVKLLQEGEQDLTKARGLVDKALMVGYVQEYSRDLVDLLEWESFRSMIQNSGLRTQKIPTMLPTFNNFSGGLGRKEVGLVIGGSGVGKSTTLVNLGAVAVSNSIPVWFVSLEMEEEDIGVQFASRLTGMSLEDIMSNRAEYSCIVNTTKKNLLRTTYYNPGSLDVPKMRAALNHMRITYGFKPELIIIDYADRMCGAKEYETLGDLFDQFKALTHDYDVGLWTASQTNRHGWGDETVGMKRVSNSSLKIANADLVWTLSQTPSENARGLIRIFIGKARRSKAGYLLRCSIDYSTCMITELSDSYISGERIKQEEDEKEKGKRYR